MIDLQVRERAGHAIGRLWAPVIARLARLRRARITLVAGIEVDQAALRFDPFRGVLEPVGLVHAIRRAAYGASQHARPDGEVRAEARSRQPPRRSTSHAAQP